LLKLAVIFVPALTHHFCILPAVVQNL
jgi:hypothetical protein